MASKLFDELKALAQKSSFGEYPCHHLINAIQSGFENKKPMEPSSIFYYVEKLCSSHKETIRWCHHVNDVHCAIILDDFDPSKDYECEHKFVEDATLFHFFPTWKKTFEQKNSRSLDSKKIQSFLDSVLFVYANYQSDDIFLAILKEKANFDKILRDSYAKIYEIFNGKINNMFNITYNMRSIVEMCRTFERICTDLMNGCDVDTIDASIGDPYDFDIVGLFKSMEFSIFKGFHTIKDLVYYCHNKENDDPVLYQVYENFFNGKSYNKSIAMKIIAERVFSFFSCKHEWQNPPYSERASVYEHREYMNICHNVWRLCEAGSVDDFVYQSSTLRIVLDKEYLNEHCEIAPRGIRDIVMLCFHHVNCNEESYSMEAFQKIYSSGECINFEEAIRSKLSTYCKDKSNVEKYYQDIMSHFVLGEDK